MREKERQARAQMSSAAAAEREVEFTSPLFGGPIRVSHSLYTLFISMCIEVLTILGKQHNLTIIVDIL